MPAASFQTESRMQGCVSTLLYPVGFVQFEPQVGGFAKWGRLPLSFCSVPYVQSDKRLSITDKIIIVVVNK